MDPALSLDFQRHAQELRDSWQARALLGGRGLAPVVLSVLGHNFDDAMPVLLRVCYPGFTSLEAPFFCSAGRIAKNGHVCADRQEKDGSVTRMFAIFRSTQHMRNEFRRLADKLKLNDDDRRQLFAAVQRWVVCDYRLDPTMNPADPDAKRLTVH